MIASCIIVHIMNNNGIIIQSFNIFVLNNKILTSIANFVYREQTEKMDIKIPRFDEFYIMHRTYHNDELHRITHCIFLPITIFSIFWFLQYVPHHFTDEEDYDFDAITLSTYLWMFSTGLYMNIDVKSGIFAGLFYLVPLILSRALYLTLITSSLGLNFYHTWSFIFLITGIVS